jgi:hypothetical protein
MRRALLGIWAAVASLYAMGSLSGPPGEQAQKSTIQAEILNKPSPPPPLAKPQGEKPPVSKHRLENEIPSSQRADLKIEPTVQSGSEYTADSEFAEANELSIQKSELAEVGAPSAETTRTLRKPAAASDAETVGKGKKASPKIETKQPLSRESASGKKKASATSSGAKKGANSRRLEARSAKQKVASKAKEKQKVASKVKEKKARKRDLSPYAMYGSPRPYPRPYVYYRPRPYVYYRPYAVAPYALRRYPYGY